MKNSEQDNDEVEILERVAPPGGQRRQNVHNRWIKSREDLDTRDKEIKKTYKRLQSLQKTAKIYNLSHQQIWNIVRGVRTRKPD